MESTSQPWWREMSRYQWLVLVVAWLGWVFDVMDTAIFNLSKGPMLTEMLGKAQYDAIGKGIEGQIQMLFIAGWAIGGVLFGVLADRWGRTKTLIATILIYCALTGLTALCRTWEQVAAIRFFTAIGIGGEWAAGAALIAEAVPNRARAGAAAILQTAAAFGPILAALANQSLAGQSWRWLFVVGIVPAALTIVIRMGVHEPERWRQAASAISGSRWFDPLREIFSDRRLRKNAIVAMTIGLVGIAGAGTVTFWMPNLVAEASVGVSATELANRQSFVTYLGHAGTLAGVLLFPMLCDRMGRRTALALFFALTPLALWIGLSGGTTYESLLWRAPMLFFFAIGLSAGFGLYFPELFPTRLRATGAGLAYNVARIGQAPIPKITAAISQAANSTAQGVLITGSIYLFGLAALIFAPETKGKELPD